MRLSAYPEAWEVSCKNHTIVSMLGTDFTYEVLPVGRHRSPLL